MIAFNPREKQLHATRVALFPLDCSRSQLKQLFRRVSDEQSRSDLESQVESIAHTALFSRKRKAARTTPDVTDPGPFAVSAALAVLRLERADPSLDYPYKDSHTRYLETPFQRNPGLSLQSQHVREYYVNTLIGLTKTQSEIAEEAATLLYALYDPAPNSTTCDEQDGPVYAYADRPVTDIYDARRNSVEVTSESIHLPRTHAIHRCRTSWDMLNHTPSPPGLRLNADSVHIPIEVFRDKLARYARHGFDRLVNKIFNQIDLWGIDSIKRNTPAIDDQLRKKDETGHTEDLYSPLYTVTGSHPDSSSRHAPTVPDPRLVGIVDTIRGTPTLEFNEYHTVSELATAARAYVPPPHRPSLPQLTPQRIRGVLSTAAEQYGDTFGPYTTDDDLMYKDTVRRRATDTGVGFLLRAPVPTPLYTPPTDDFQHTWTGYKHLLSRQATKFLPDDAAVASILDQHDPIQAPITDKAVTHARNATATTPHTKSLTAVTPHITSNNLTDDATSLTHDELVYLTRIAKGMYRLLSDTSLHDGMAHYDQGLDVDPSDLVSRDWLEEHPEPRVTLYTLPRDRIRQLGLRPLAQEGYSDNVFEKSLHKYSAATLQQHLASQSNANTTYRYLDLWRLDIENDAVASIIADSPTIGSGLASGDAAKFTNSRADVLGVNTDLNGDELSVPNMHIGEALTTSNNQAAPARNWDKLAILGQLGATTHWIFPSGKHASNTIQELCKQDRINAPATSLADDRSPRECHQFVSNHDPDNPGIDYIHGIRNLHPI